METLFCCFHFRFEKPFSGIKLYLKICNLNVFLTYISYRSFKKCISTWNSSLRMYFFNSLLSFIWLLRLHWLILNLTKMFSQELNDLTLPLSHKIVANLKFISVFLHLYTFTWFYTLLFLHFHMVISVILHTNGYLSSIKINSHTNWVKINLSI